MKSSFISYCVAMRIIFGLAEYSFCRLSSPQSISWYCSCDSRSTYVTFSMKYLPPGTGKESNPPALLSCVLPSLIFTNAPAKPRPGIRLPLSSSFPRVFTIACWFCACKAATAKSTAIMLHILFINSRDYYKVTYYFYLQK